MLSATNGRNAPTPAATTVFSATGRGLSLPVGFRGAIHRTRRTKSLQGQRHVPQALALAAQIVATLALLVVLALNLFVLGLAFRTNRPPEFRAGTRDVQHYRRL